MAGGPEQFPDQTFFLDQQSIEPVTRGEQLLYGLHAVDALTSLAQAYGVPIVLFIAWAGYKGRDVPHHNSIGKPLVPFLEALNIPYLEVNLDGQPEDIAIAVKHSIAMANCEGKSGPVAVLGIPKELADKE